MGGNFWDGVRNGAISAGLNHAAHRVLDLTNQFNQQLRKTKEYFAARKAYYDEISLKMIRLGVWESYQANEQMRAIEFYDLVKTGSPYDIKNDKQSAFSVAKLGKAGAMYGKEHFRTDDFGNYNYGVAAKAYGYALKFAQFGAGMYQIKSGTSSFNFHSTYFDDPRDYSMIMRGYLHFK